MDIRSVLAECTLFAQLTPDALDGLTRHATPLRLRGGAQLFAAGDESDAMYIVATGRLKVMLTDGTFLGYAARLEPVGEIGLISGEPRTAHVHAIRDSLLIRIASADLLAFLLAHPPALVAIARVLIHRLRENQRVTKRQLLRSGGTVAVIPATPGVDALTLAGGIAQNLARDQDTQLLDAARVDRDLGAGAALSDTDDGALVEWLNRLEQKNHHLVYVANRQPDAWTLRCLRQADRVLVVVSAGAPVAAAPMMAALKASGILATIELVLVKNGGAEFDTAPDIKGWKNWANARTHYFVAADDDASVARLARQLSGRGVGLVLGGGGARGFAHLGLLRALHELEIPVDLVGGSSMGALIGALLASGLPLAAMADITRDMFVDNNLLNDYTFPPRVSLIRGRKFTRKLKEIFGERRIEDLLLPYFCVSTSLTRGEPVLHDEGPLAAWVTASMSVPGIAPPTVWQEELLVDGAVGNSLPTDLMQALGRGPIIASDVSTEGGLHAPGVEGPDAEALLNWNGPTVAPGLRDILFRSATLTSQSGVKRRAEMADVYLRMPVGEIGMFDWKRMDEIIDKGYRFALEHVAPEREKLMK